MGFDADWLAARAPYDEAALDQSAIAAIQSWAEQLPADRELVVVDLGSGTGVALGRVRRWLGSRRMVAYAVDQDTNLLAQVPASSDDLRIVPIVGDVLAPLDGLGGPADGTVDLVVGHAIADLLPLDRLAARVAALLRPGGLAHLALVYDGLTAFEPPTEPDLDAKILRAFHHHMNRPGKKVRHYGGSTAGRRLGAHLMTAGLEVLVDAPSVWDVRAAHGEDGEKVLDRLIRFILDADHFARHVGPVHRGMWAISRWSALRAGTLAAQVGHRDLLARKPTTT